MLRKVKEKINKLIKERTCQLCGTPLNKGKVNFCTSCQIQEMVSKTLERTYR